MKHLHEASGFTGNTTSNLYTHLGHSNCYLPPSISDEETEGQIHEMTNFPECESSDLISCFPVSVFLAVEDREHTQFSSLKRLPGSLGKEGLLDQEPEG